MWKSKTCKGKRKTNDKFRNRLVPVRLARVLNSTLTVERVSYIREELKGNQKGTYESERGAK